ncbi:MAG: hypothetical protein IJW00_00140 [Clostridia bacterium]|nr:hypothetical protein [Clostridia bacterium]
MEYLSIKTPADARAFCEAVNSLHDGEILSVQYTHNGFERKPDGLWCDPAKTQLHLTVLVTSIWDSVVELVFESIDEWQLQGNSLAPEDIFCIRVEFAPNGSVVWTTGHSTEPEIMKENRYVIAHSMKWRFIEDNRP